MAGDYVLKVLPLLAAPLIVAAAPAAAAAAAAPVAGGALAGGALAGGALAGGALAGGAVTGGAATGAGTALAGGALAGGGAALTGGATGGAVTGAATGGLAAGTTATTAGTAATTAGTTAGAVTETAAGSGLKEAAKKLLNPRQQTKGQFAAQMAQNQANSQANQRQQEHAAQADRSSEMAEKAKNEANVQKAAFHDALLFLKAWDFYPSGYSYEEKEYIINEALKNKKKHGSTLNHATHRSVSPKHVGERWANRFHPAQDMLPSFLSRQNRLSRKAKELEPHEIATTLADLLLTHNPELREQLATKVPPPDKRLEDAYPGLVLPTLTTDNPKEHEGDIHRTFTPVYSHSDEDNGGKVGMVTILGHPHSTAKNRQSVHVTPQHSIGYKAPTETSESGEKVESTQDKNTRILNEIMNTQGHANIRTAIKAGLDLSVKVKPPVEGDTRSREIRVMEAKGKKAKERFSKLADYPQRPMGPNMFGPDFHNTLMENIKRLNPNANIRNIPLLSPEPEPEPEPEPVEERIWTQGPMPGMYYLNGNISTEQPGPGEKIYDQQGNVVEIIPDIGKGSLLEDIRLLKHLMLLKEMRNDLNLLKGQLQLPGQLAESLQEDIMALDPNHEIVETGEGSTINNINPFMEDVVSRLHDMHEEENPVEEPLFTPATLFY